MFEIQLKKFQAFKEAERKEKCIVEKKERKRNRPRNDIDDRIRSYYNNTSYTQ